MHRLPRMKARYRLLWIAFVACGLSLATVVSTLGLRIVAPDFAAALLVCGAAALAIAAVMLAAAKSAGAHASLIERL